MVFCGSGGTTIVEGCACCTGVGVGAVAAEVSFGAAVVVSVAGFLALALCTGGVAGLAAEAWTRFRQAALDEVVLRVLQ
jgi:hypothetical protein